MSNRNSSERAFRTELLKKAEEAEFHTIPIPDDIKSTGKRFMVVRIYDCGLVDPLGNYHAIEIKQVRSGYGLSLSHLSEAQELNLLDATRLAKGWLIVHHVARLSKAAVKRWNRENLDMAWAVPIQTVVAARDRDGHNTLTPEWLNENGLLIMERGRWSLMRLYENDLLERAVG